MAPPGTRYVKTGDEAYIAFQVGGAGSFDVLVTFGPGLDIEDQATGPWTGALVERLERVARVVRVDRRGHGLSDPLPTVDVASWELWVDDMITVLDAIAVERTVVFAVEPPAGIVSMLLAAAHPQRISHLVLFNPAARWLRAPDYPWGFTEDEARKVVDQTLATWLHGSPPPFRTPRWFEDEQLRSWFVAARRRAISPSVVRAVFENGLGSDVRAVLPAIQVPTLVMHTEADWPHLARRAGYVAERIPGARTARIPGIEGAAYMCDVEAVVAEIEEFVTGTRSEPAVDRVLATVLFTDIESSTATVAAIGDRAWREVLDRFRRVVREQLARHRGREINTRGDDFLATFEGPARAIRCALDVANAAAALGIGVRSGLHCGEIELIGDDIGGIVVHIGARVAEAAGGGEVLVSRTVVDLVAGSGFAFVDRGEHDLKGVPGTWRLFAVDPR